jgi:hypothetical protein
MPILDFLNAIALSYFLSELLLSPDAAAAFGAASTLHDNNNGIRKVPLPFLVFHSVLLVTQFIVLLSVLKEVAEVAAADRRHVHPQHCAR